MKKILICVFLLFPFAISAAMDLSAVIPVERSANTGAAAKNAAMRDARIGAVVQILSRYADPSAIDAAATKSNDSSLQSIIASTEIENEKAGATIYSANVKITLDGNAAQKWLGSKGIANTLSSSASATVQKIPVLIKVNGLREWITLNRNLREAGVMDGLQMDIRSIFGGQITATVLSNRRIALESAVRDIGWHSSVGEDGVLEIYK